MKVKVTKRSVVKSKKQVKKPAKKSARKAPKKKAAKKIKVIQPNVVNIRDPEWREVCAAMPMPVMEQKAAPGSGPGPFCEVLVKHQHVLRSFRKLEGGINPATGKDKLDPVVYSTEEKFSRVWVRVWIGNETNGRGHVLRQQLPPGVKEGEVVRWAGGSKQSPAKLVETLIKA